MGVCCGVEVDDVVSLHDQCQAFDVWGLATNVAEETFIVFNVPLLAHPQLESLDGEPVGLAEVFQPIVSAVLKDGVVVFLVVVARFEEAEGVGAVEVVGCLPADLLGDAEEGQVNGWLVPEIVGIDGAGESQDIAVD